MLPNSATTVSIIINIKYSRKGYYIKLGLTRLLNLLHHVQTKLFWQLLLFSTLLILMMMSYQAKGEISLSLKIETYFYQWFVYFISVLI